VGLKPQAGAFALSENNLYTTDAFHDLPVPPYAGWVCLHSLAGVSIRRAKSLRLVSLAMTALAGLGQKMSRGAMYWSADPAGKSELHGWGALDTVIFFTLASERC